MSFETENGQIDDFFGEQEEEPLKSNDCELLEDDNACDLYSKGLHEHEDRYTKVQFRNVGYHEAFEGAKDTKLQEGFENGYIEMMDVSMTLGKQLGRVSIQQALTGLCDEELSDAISRVKRLFTEDQKESNLKNKVDQLCNDFKKL